MSPILPPELLDAVLAQVSGRETLESFALCSRQLHDLTLPYLYRSMEPLLPPLQKEQKERMASAGDSAKLAQFHLRHLNHLFLQKPQLALHVRTLRVRGMSNHEARVRLARHHRQPIELVDVEPHLAAAIESRSVSQEQAESWMQDCTIGARAFGTDGLLALLIAQLPCLETLTVMPQIIVPNDASIPLPWTSFVLQRIAERSGPFNSPYSFDRLRSIHWKSDTRHHNGALYRGLFANPTAHSLRLGQICRSFEPVAVPRQFFNPRTRCLFDLSERCSNIEHLELTSEYTHHLGLDLVLRIPRNLRTFILNADLFFYDPGRLPFLRLLEVIQFQQASLENLWLDLPHGTAQHRSQSRASRPMTSLRAFGKLKRLRIASLFVFQPTADAERSRLCEFLPPQLQSLRLTRCHDKPGDCFHCLHHLFEEKRTLDILPQLSTVTLEIPESALQTFTDLHPLAREARVNLTLLEKPSQELDEYIFDAERIEW